MATISTSTNASATGPGNNTLVTIAADGTALVSWYDGSSAKISYAASPYSSWTSATLTSAARFAVALLLDTSDNVAALSSVASPAAIDYVPLTKSGATYSVGSNTHLTTTPATGTIGGVLMVAKDTRGRYWSISNTNNNTACQVYDSSTPATATWATSLNLTAIQSNSHVPAADLVGSYLVVMYSTATTTFKYQRMDTSVVSLGAWSTATTLSGLTGAPDNTKRWSFRGNGSDTGILIYTSASGIYAMPYTASTDTWGTAVQLSTGASDTHPTLCKVDSDIYAFWCSYVGTSNYALVYKKYTSATATWDPAATTLVAGGTNVQNPMAGYGNTTIGVMYTVGTASPYTVAFATIATSTTTTSTRPITGVSAAVQALDVKRNITGVSSATKALGIEKPITGVSAAVQALGITRPTTGSVSVSLSALVTSTRPITSVSAALQATGVPRLLTSISAAVQALGVPRSLLTLSASIGAGGIVRAISSVSAVVQALGVGRPLTSVSAAVQQLGIPRTLSPVSASLSSLSPLAAPMPIVSRGLPAYANAGTASYGNDSNYGHDWRSSTVPAYLAYDISSLSDAQKSQSIAVWYNKATGDYDHVIAGGVGYNIPGTYTIDANTAAGGSLPGSGWTTLVTVSSNVLHSRQHALNLSGYNWVRLSVTVSDGSTSNTGAECKFELFNTAPHGVSDNWIIYGDSITSELFNLRDNNGPIVPALITAGNAAYTPLMESGAIGGVTSATGVAQIDTWLSLTQAKYIGLDYGGNDANTHMAASTFYTNMETMVIKVLAANKIPVIPKIAWAGNGTNKQLYTPDLNAKIDDLWAAYPDIVHGPDVWTFILNNPGYLSGDGIHFTTAGYTAVRQYWAATLLAAVYGTKTLANISAAVQVLGIMKPITGVSVAVAVSTTTYTRTITGVSTATQAQGLTRPIAGVSAAVGDTSHLLIASDNYTRADTVSGWGTSTNTDGVTNYAWGIDGTGVGVKITSNRGISNNAATDYTAILDDGTSRTLAEVLCKFSVSASSANVRGVIRHSGGATTGTDSYRAGYSNGAMEIRSRRASTSTVRATTAFTATLIQDYWIRFQVVTSGGGNPLCNLRWWADGASEPSTWGLSWEDTTGNPVPTGAIGLQLNAGGSATSISIGQYRAYDVSAPAGAITYTRPITGVSAALQAAGVPRPIAGVSAATQALGITRPVVSVSSAIQSLGLTRPLVNVSTSLVFTGTRPISGVSSALLASQIARPLANVSGSLLFTGTRPITGVSGATKALGVERGVIGVSGSVGAGGISRTIIGVGAALQALGVPRTIAGVSGATLQPGITRPITSVSTALVFTGSRPITGIATSLLFTGSRSLVSVSAATQALGVSRPIANVSGAVGVGGVTRSIMGVSAATKALGVTRDLSGISGATIQVGITRPLSPISASISLTRTRTITGVSSALKALDVQRPLITVSAATKALGVTRPLGGITGAIGQGGITRTIIGVSVAVQAIGIARNAPSVSSALQAIGVTRSLIGVSAATKQIGLVRDISGVSVALAQTVSRTLTPISSAVQATVSRTLVGISSSVTLRSTRPLTGISGAVKAFGVVRPITGILGAIGVAGLTRTLTDISASVYFEGKMYTYITVVGARGTITTEGTRGTITVEGARGTITVQED